MLVNEAMRRILFNIGGLDDITGKAVNPLINNRQIIDMLNSQLRQYASVTRGISDVYSFPLNTNTPFVAAPTLAIRNRPYYYAFVIVSGVIYPCDVRGPADIYPRFSINPQTGIVNWIMPWYAGKTQYLSTFPMRNTSANTTTLSSAITDTATTLTVVSTSGYINNHGRVTIESEKILYTYKDSTHFYGCVRGVEMTTAANHAISTTVTENNMVLFYSRLPVKITVTDNNMIEKSVLDREIEVVDDHMEGIIRATTYPLLLKIDPERAQMYKIDADALYAQYANDIKRGFFRGRSGANVRDPFVTHELGQPYGTNLRY